MSETSAQDSPAGAPKTAALERQAREAAALRANLARRKQQARERGEAPPSVDPE